jgi:hypothetical protein
MPYFPQLNILLIHIPKTGGTSIEKYFENITNIKLSKINLYSSNNEKLYGHTLQHLTYNEIYSIKDITNIDINNINIISIIRNPYERIISELFFQNMININSNYNDVAYNLYKYINSNNIYDNHKIPQYKFLLDNNNKINNKIKILKTETLNNDMINIGFIDFNLNELKNKNSNINYYSYLNDFSINIINDYYNKDFELLPYKKINININKNIIIDKNITINEFFSNSTNNNNNTLLILIILIILYIIYNIFYKK